MKKFAANYLVSESGEFIKNGIILATDQGDCIEVIDQGEDLREIAQLTFFNGIVMTNFRFVEIRSDFQSIEPVTLLESAIFQLFAEINEISIQVLIETGIHIQEQFPEMIIPQILNEISKSLLKDARFSRMNVPGIYLLSGVNLSELKFTDRSKLKKLLP